MNILLFNSHFKEKNVSSWITFINYFKKDNKIFILSEDEISNNIIKSKIVNAQCNSINFDIIKRQLIKLSTKEIYNKYKDTNLFQERLSIKNSYYSILKDDDEKFEKNISFHIMYFEEYLKINKINIVFMCIINAYESYIYSILENVTKKIGLKVIMFQHPILRGFIYENQLRFSSKIYEDYKKFLDKGLEKKEIEKSKAAIENYKNFVRAENYYKYIYKKKLKIKPKIKKFFSNFSKKQKLKINKVVNLEYIKSHKNKISILLLNKNDNYRNFKFSPHFSIPETLIRSIALSLPFEHTLIVKPHPHNYITDDRLIEEINLHYNVKLLSQKIHLHDVMPNMNLVFAQSTTSTIESLMYYKHLILFGKQNQFFGDKFDFITRISDLEKLKEKIEYLLYLKVNKNKIDTFFYSLFSNSLSRDLNSDEDWNNVILKMDEKDVFLKAAIAIKSYLEEKK